MDDLAIKHSVVGMMAKVLEKQSESILELEEINKRLTREVEELRLSTDVYKQLAFQPRHRGC